MFALFLVLTLTSAAIDWWAASTGTKRLEFVFKPLTMVLLIAATVAMVDPVDSAARSIVVVALVFSLIGDVCLMLEERYFLGGLAAFLLAHVAYIPALVLLGVTVPMLLVGVLVAVVAAALVGTRVVSRARSSDPRMAIPVAAYMVVISAMVIAAIGTGNPWAIVGALLFYFSDGCIGWDRFVAPLPVRSLFVMVTYHLGQIGLVLALTV